MPYLVKGETMEEKRIKIYSYTKVWKWEKKIYSISNIPLPMPVNPYDLLYFVGFALLMVVLGKIIPAITAIPVVLRFVAFPYIITTYLMKKKVDGKNPIKYFAGCIRYFFMERGSYLQTFKRHPDRKEKLSIKWNCSMGIKQ